MYAFPRNPEGGLNEFTVMICDQCDGPIVVYTGPQGHFQKLNAQQHQDVVMIATNFGNQYYGVGNWQADFMQRTIPDHFHMHIRRIDYDSHIPLFRTFDDPFPKDHRTLTVVNLRSLEEVKQVSHALILQHGKTQSTKEDLKFIILDKLV